jgi:hypothetical protein
MEGSMENARPGTRKKKKIRNLERNSPTLAGMREKKI